MKKKEETVLFQLVMEVNCVVDKRPLGSRALEKERKSPQDQENHKLGSRPATERKRQKRRKGKRCGFAQKGRRTKQNPVAAQDC